MTKLLPWVWAEVMTKGNIDLRASFYTSPQIVASLFSGLLLRPAAKEDIDLYVGKLSDGEMTVEDLTRDISDSEEFKTTRGPNIALAFDGSEQMVRKFEHVISFGSHCYTGKLLQKAQMKKFSTPFDWTPSNAGMISHCINDDFVQFLDRSLYEAGNPPVHQFYKSAFDIPRFHQHHNPLVAANHDYLVRSVSRFRGLVRSNAAVLCLLISEKWKIDHKQFARLADTLSDKMPAARLVGIGVHSPSGYSLKCGYEINTSFGEHLLLDYHSAGHLGALDFSEGIDNINLIRLLHRLGA